MLKLLLIDDEEGIRKLLSISLRNDGYDVITAENGEKGIEIFKKEEPSIVLTDIKMPGINGIEVLRKIKQINPDTEIIIITGYGDMDKAVKSIQLDASDFIEKPINKYILSKALRRAEAKLKVKQTLKHYTFNLEMNVKEKTEALEKSHKEIRAICNVTYNLGDKKYLADAFDLIIEKIRNIFLFEEIVPLVFNQAKEEFIDIGGYRSAPGEYKEELVSFINSISTPVHIDGLNTSDCRWLKKYAGYKSLSVIPIGKSDIVGAVILLASDADVFSKDDSYFLYLMLSQVAADIRKIALNEERLKGLDKKVKMFSGFGGIIGKDHKMLQIYNLILDIAPTNATVLIQGESGSGKELIAKAVHLNSRRKGGRFVVVNCSAYPHTLLESELFGHEKGAFTGATNKKIGRFELANEGTLFLDEIGEISLISQVKLLRFLQFQKFERLGGTRTIGVNTRIIAATNKDLSKEVEKGNFREDLYYRLNVIPINVPPLRVRRSDISLLVEYFVEELNSRGNKKIKGVTPNAMQLLINHNWPGNVRELKNIIEHSFILTKDEYINEQNFPGNILLTAEKEDKVSSFQENEKNFLTEVLGEYNWNKSRVAKKLNISRSTLYAKMKKYNLNHRDK